MENESKIRRMNEHVRGMKINKAMNSKDWFNYGRDITNETRYM